ncbi:PREDICTED: RNA polymerase II subunit A C-terminal domain phosphatase [Condylura cristata]|uniref:RNA polymerase II subunit A C-terminal domain phosphatase n=1 Tax=Condylura cristata TaxID=143302 RepID=UPI00064339BD|nr:PREDICTED: RNA polymerase II subunit A C-terminal domain phosphatase [Condylura cristata]
MKGLCAECGQDLTQLQSKDGKQQAPLSTATVSMVHSVPELMVSCEQAERLGREDQQRLHRDRKLVLMVDLDQTLIHTTEQRCPQMSNRPPVPEAPQEGAGLGGPVLSPSTPRRHLPRGRLSPRWPHRAAPVVPSDNGPRPSPQGPDAFSPETIEAPRATTPQPPASRDPEGGCGGAARLLDLVRARPRLPGAPGPRLRFPLGPRSRLHTLASVQRERQWRFNRPVTLDPEQA